MSKPKSADEPKTTTAAPTQEKKFVPTPAYWAKQKNKEALAKGASMTFGFSLEDAMDEKTFDAHIEKYGKGHVKG